LTKQFDLNLAKSYFYTDSAEDMPLMEIVGHPIAINPDPKLSNFAFQNDWPIYRFDDDQPSKLTGLIRTGLAASSLIPGAMLGVLAGVNTLSWENGVNMI